MTRNRISMCSVSSRCFVRPGGLRWSRILTFSEEPSIWRLILSICAISERTNTRSIHLSRSESDIVRAYSDSIRSNGSEKSSLCVMRKLKRSCCITWKVSANRRLPISSLLPLHRLNIDLLKRMWRHATLCMSSVSDASGLLRFHEPIFLRLNLTK